MQIGKLLLIVLQMNYFPPENCLKYQNLHRKIIRLKVSRDEEGEHFYMEKILFIVS